MLRAVSDWVAVPVEVAVRCLFVKALHNEPAAARCRQQSVNAAGAQPEYPVAVRPIEVAIGGHRQTEWRLLQHHLVVAARLADPEDHWVRVVIAPAGCDVQKAIGPFDHAREEVAVEIAVRVLRSVNRVVNCPSGVTSKTVPTPR